MLVLTLVFLRLAYLPRRFREILLLDIFPTERNFQSVDLFAKRES
jgi:hypothetical protein